MRFWRSAGHFGASYVYASRREICTVPSLYIDHLIDTATVDISVDSISVVVSAVLAC